MKDESNRREYFSAYPLNHPAYGVVRRAAWYIRERAKTHFHGRLLEIGCGTKAKRHLVGEFVDEHVGLDHPDCPHDHSHIDVFGSAYDMPLDDESFDCVLSTAVLEHLEQPKGALAEAYRVLKPGGVGLYTAPLFWHVHEAPRDFFRYTEYGLRCLAEGVGFEVVEVTPMSGFLLTFGAELGYFLQRFRSGFLKRPVDALVASLNLALPALDRGVLRDEKFTWMYLLVVRRPVR